MTNINKNNDTNKLLCGVVVEHIYYTVRLSDGTHIPFDKNYVDNKKVFPNAVVKGYVNREEIQDRYEDGTYARSYSTIVDFIMKI